MSELAQTIQAILFVAAEPLDYTTLCQALAQPEEDVQAALDELETVLRASGLRLQHHQDQWQLVTAADQAGAVTRFLQHEAKTELSRAALETLAMVAYRGPITRAELDELRGVGSDTMIRNLLQRGLITEAGRATSAGRPVQYSVSHRFLQHLGLTSLAELPPLDEAA